MYQRNFYLAAFSSVVLTFRKNHEHAIKNMTNKKRFVKGYL